MKTSALLLAMGFGLGGMTGTASAAQLNEDAVIGQIANGISNSDAAVACQLRTGDWRHNVVLGYFGMTRLAVMADHPDLSDDELDAHVIQMIKDAKVRVALHAQFAAPTQTTCDKLGKSHTLEEMDSAAKIGMLVGAVSE